MTLEFVKKCIEEKMQENENFIKYTYYWVRVKKDVPENEINIFIEYSKNYFENNGYNIFFKGEEYLFNNNVSIVKDNEILVAIKKDKKEDYINGKQVNGSKHRRIKSKQ